MKLETIVLSLLFSLNGLIAFAQDAQRVQVDRAGLVELPLHVYNQLVEQAESPRRIPRPAPASYALGSARVTVRVPATEPRASGNVQVQLTIEVLESEWVLIPILPAGTPVETVTVGGNPVQLIATPDGLAWSTNKAGSYAMNLSYQVDATRSESGYVLPIPLPEAAAINLNASLPGTGLDVAVIPAAGTRTTVSGATTEVHATVPTTSGVQISWRVPARRGASISSAYYSGRLVGDAVLWTGELAVELFSDETVTLPFLARTVTLSRVQVDGKNAPILVEGDSFATLVKGQGGHRVQVGFQVPVIRKDGPPKVDLQIPRIPVSRFELSLPGKKELAVTPAANVTTRQVRGSTVATVHVPMTERVSFTWSEAVPEASRAELRSNAGLYHAVHAEEGVLYVRAMVHYEVSRGETNVVELAVPTDVQIDRIAAESGAVTDWRITPARGNQPRTVRVLLDRQLKGDLLFDVYYDHSLSAAEPSAVPLMRAMNVQRQRGMVALLASSELTLNPVQEGDATRVGENQLPTFVREAIGMTVAHTYRYVETPPELIVEPSVPERVQGRYDAQIDTLISLGEAVITGAASVEIHVKSGGIMELQLGLPENHSLLSLTSPSLRTHRVEAGADGNQVIDIEFTQEMEGDFRLELAYERVLSDGGEQASTLEVPTVHVVGAEVEQGQIAVEALSAVEVRPAATEHISAVEINELPRRLILRTTNPILLAYKYVAAEPPHRLALQVTRHSVVDVQEAAIDWGRYRTLITRDGLMVTTASFAVRNTNKQFLGVRLPENSEIWAAFVNGKPEKPAHVEVGDEEGKGKDILIKIINSSNVFPVELIYATEGPGIGRLGTIEAELPRPDILVTQSLWDIYLPDEMSYGTPRTNMDLVGEGTKMSREEMKRELDEAGRAASGQQALEPLRITVPSSGVHYAFEKLYANQAERPAWFSMAYASTGGAVFGQFLNLTGAGLLWLGIVLYLKRGQSPVRAIAVSGAGLLLLVVTMGVFNLSATLPLAISLFMVVLVAVSRGRKTMEQWRQARTIEQS